MIAILQLDIEIELKEEWPPLYHQLRDAFLADQAVAVIVSGNECRAEVVSSTESMGGGRWGASFRLVLTTIP